MTKNMDWRSALKAERNKLDTNAAPDGERDNNKKTRRGKRGGRKATGQVAVTPIRLAKARFKWAVLDSNMAKVVLKFEAACRQVHVAELAELAHALLPEANNLRCRASDLLDDHDKAIAEHERVLEDLAESRAATTARLARSAGTLQEGRSTAALKMDINARSKQTERLMAREVELRATMVDLQNRAADAAKRADAIDRLKDTEETYDVDWAANIRTADAELLGLVTEFYGFWAADNDVQNAGAALERARCALERKKRDLEASEAHAAQVEAERLARQREEMAARALERGFKRFRAAEVLQTLGEDIADELEDRAAVELALDPVAAFTGCRRMAPAK